MKTITILGSTGSIGTQALEVANKHNIRIKALAAHSNVDLLASQAIENNAEYACIYDKDKIEELKSLLRESNVKVLSGMDGLNFIASLDGVDIMLNSVVGMVGLTPTLTAIEHGTDIALANKETLVTGGKLVNELAKEKGVEILYVTLHVGLGTFRPVNEEDITKHHMHSERYIMTKDVADKLNKAKEEGRKIYAVGTTSTRTLESIMNKYHKFVECDENTNIFIYPGYKFLAIDGLITNFHLPKSTLVMLVSAFSTRENILNAYNHAIKNNYHFFSFGDAMFIK